MDVLVGTASGGHLVYQVAAGIHLTRYEYKPSLCLGISGGGMLMPIMSAGDWTPNGVRRVFTSIESRLFVEDYKGSSKLLPRSLSSFFGGAMYESSRYSSRIITTYFDEETLQDTEIWVAAINEKTRGLSLWCNRNRDDAIIKGVYLDPLMLKFEPLKYLNGDLEGFTDAVLASASIPIAIKPKEIGGEIYVDGGVNFGSPLTPLQNELLAISRKGGIHITYLPGYDVRSSIKIRANLYNGKANSYDHLATIPDHAIRGFVEQDRRTAHSIIADSCITQPWHKEVDLSKLDWILERRKLCYSSLVEVYPKGNEAIEIFSFNKYDAENLLDKCMNELGVRVWWSGGRDIFEGGSGETNTKTSYL